MSKQLRDNKGRFKKGASNKKTRRTRIKKNRRNRTVAGRNKVHFNILPGGGFYSENYGRTEKNRKIDTESYHKSLKKKRRR